MGYISNNFVGRHGQNATYPVATCANCGIPSRENKRFARRAANILLKCFTKKNLLANSKGMPQMHTWGSRIHWKGRFRIHDTWLKVEIHYFSLTITKKSDEDPSDRIVLHVGMAYWYLCIITALYDINPHKINSKETVGIQYSEMPGFFSMIWQPVKPWIAWKSSTVK